MLKTTSHIVCLCAIFSFSAAASAQFNGLTSNPRVFNDYPNSTLTITNSNSIPGSVTIDDRNLTNATGNGANRHDVLLSKDHGATAYTFPTSEPFTISTNLRLTDGSNTPRKEAGIRINSPVTGDVLLIVNSDAGEIVSFGGGAQFHLFGNNGNSNGYTPGQTILLGMTYRPGVPSTTSATPASIEYFINRGAGIETTGPLAWGNLEGGPSPTFQVGVYAQGGSGNNASDFFTAQFTNLTAVPEPAGLGGLLLAGTAVAARRRRGVKVG
jgi:hypothetical protein